MDIGLILPQGWTGEYDGWDPARAWARTVGVAQAAERLGYESLWVFDHVQTVPVPTDEITFESFTTLTALAALTRRVRLGHVVLCAPFRNAALTGKMISTLDVVSGGRAELGLGAGWKEDEFRGYGYPYPGDARSASPSCARPWRSRPGCWAPVTPPTRAPTCAWTTPSTCPRASSRRACRSWSAATGPT